MPSRNAPRPARRSQQDRSSATRTLLIDAGRRLFAERGYAGVSADEISAAAGLTRGALYHHYGGKEELFAAVFEDLEREVAAEIGAVLSGPPAVSSAGPPAAIARFLDLCVRPDVIRIALTDAPAVLGWERWRQIESAHGLGLVAEALQAAVDAGLVIAVPVRTLAQLVLSAVIEAALLIAHSPEPRQARAEADQALAALLHGLVG